MTPGMGAPDAYGLETDVIRLIGRDGVSDRRSFRAIEYFKGVPHRRTVSRSQNLVSDSVRRCVFISRWLDACAGNRMS